MDELSAFERRLAAGLEAYAGERRSVDADAVARAAASRLPLRKRIRLRFTAGVAPAPRLAWRPIAVVAIVAVLTLALAVGAVIVGSQPTRRPALLGPTSNGLIAYAFGGDIYVGDPVTGQTTAIVTGTEVDSSPKFSPDGSRIAFIRGDPSGEDASIIVVRADGSDERVAMPAGSQHGIGFTWTPNGLSLLVNHDSEPRRSTGYYAGELSLVDAAGEAELRLITPPLPVGIGGGYFSKSDQVAPMFQPPDGDVILSVAGEGSQVVSPGLYAWDADLERGRAFGEHALKPFEPFLLQPWALWWSPDGSTIGLHVCSPQCEEVGFFLMNADGTNLRRLEGVEWGTKAWSPDGSEIAYQRGCPDPGRQGAVIVIRDLASGAERVLEATAVETKYEGDVSPTPPGAPGESGGCYGGWFEGPSGRAWDYEGWSWSPDGQSIVMLERTGTRPLVIDVESGEATELPWEADSAPSWQRISASNPE